MAPGACPGADSVRDHLPEFDLQRKLLTHVVLIISEELRMSAVAQKVDSVTKIVGRRKSLFALSREASDLFGITNEPKAVL